MKKKIETSPELSMNKNHVKLPFEKVHQITGMPRNEQQNATLKINQTNRKMSQYA